MVVNPLISESSHKTLDAAIDALYKKQDCPGLIRDAFKYIFTSQYDMTRAQRLLTLFAAKGETYAELESVIKVYEKLGAMVPFEVPQEIRDSVIDVCGTGGDGKKTLNISTAVAFVAAGAGVPVVKHGNRAVSSRSGSSDVLSLLGVEIDVHPGIMVEALQESNVAFLYAPKYHPKFKEFAPLRAKLAMRTIFNILGPLINPAKPKRQLIGVYDKDAIKLVGQYLGTTGKIHALVVHSKDGMDELSSLAVNDMAEVKQKEVQIKTLDPVTFNFPNYSGSLAGGDARDNAVRLYNLLENKDETPYRNTVLLNAAAAIYVGGVASSIEEGIELATESLVTGRALESLKILVKITQRPKSYHG